MTEATMHTKERSEAIGRAQRALKALGEHPRSSKKELGHAREHLIACYLGCWVRNVSPAAVVSCALDAEVWPPGNPSVGLDELLEHWTVLDDERPVLSGKGGTGLLGFALLLKFYVQHGRFPRGQAELLAQHDALVAAGCDQVFIDKASGKLARRPELDKALLCAQPGGRPTCRHQA